MTVVFQRRHRRSVRFISNLPNKNAPAPISGNKDRKNFLRYHLVCRKNRPPQSRCQHTVSP